MRLLGFDPKLKREVSTQLLIAEQTFGVDHLFHNQPFRYRAVAASAGLVASIHVDDLKQWLKRLPNLQRYLQKITCERQTLIFQNRHRITFTYQPFFTPAFTLLGTS